MKAADFIIQILHFVFAIGYLLLNYTDSISIIFITAFFLGCWQVLSCILTFVIMHRRFSSGLKMHYFRYAILVVLYFVMLFAGNYFNLMDFEEPLFWILTCGGPLLLALYYLQISYFTIRWNDFVRKRESLI